jgi:hypothetical protein
MSEEREIQSMIGERIWKLKDTDQARFIKEVREYFALGMPGYKVVRAKYPHIFIKKDNTHLV